MDMVYFRVCDESSITSQQNQILKYLMINSLNIDKKIIEVSSKLKKVSERIELQEILNTLKENDNLIIYHLKALSPRVGELINILTHLLSKSINIHVSFFNIKITKDTPSLELLEYIDSIREENIAISSKKIGRPKGVLSKSKFDSEITNIILMLKDGFSVSEIARRLEVSRSSLKDYINSRNLKQLAIEYNCIEKNQ